MSTNEQPEQPKPTPKSKIRSKRHEERLASPPRRPTPSSILMYIGLVILTQIVGAVFPGFPPFDLSGGGMLFLFLRLLIIFLLVNRSVIGWIIGLLLETFTIIVFSMELAAVGVENAPKLIAMLFLTVAALALLLTRQTRSHIWAADPPVQKPSETTASDGDDAEQARETDEKRQADASSSSPSSSGSG
jgi:hypothetical protein